MFCSFTDFIGFDLFFLTPLRILVFPAMEVDIASHEKRAIMKNEKILVFPCKTIYLMVHKEHKARRHAREKLVRKV